MKVSFFFPMFPHCYHSPESSNLVAKIGLGDSISSPPPPAAGHAEEHDSEEDLPELVSGDQHCDHHLRLRDTMVMQDESKF